MIAAKVATTTVQQKLLKTARRLCVCCPLCEFTRTVAHQVESGHSLGQVKRFLKICLLTRSTYETQQTYGVNCESTRTRSQSVDSPPPRTA